MNSYQSNLDQAFSDKLLQQAYNDEIQKVVVGGVIKRNEFTLVVQRNKNDFLGGLVEIPSGSIDKNENLLDGLAREIFEETGLKITSVEKYISFFDYRSSSGKKTRQFNFVVFATEDEVVLNPSEHEWFSWIKIPSIEFDRLNISNHTREVLIKSEDE